MKARFATKYHIKQMFTKIERLLAAKRRNCFNVELDGKRYSGERMKDLMIDDESVSFSYGEENIKFMKADIFMARRIRSRKYLILAGRASTFKQMAEKKGGPAPKLDEFANKVAKKVLKKPKKAEKTEKKTKKEE